ncbi:MAG TPA: ribonuclease R [Actinobacteria bacterium]|nr:ribonuclease R [Actinomycetes bacterium]HEX21358.1 ribonuclease R [Actinomycetota bacterium]
MQTTQKVRKLLKNNIDHGMTWEALREELGRDVSPKELSRVLTTLTDEGKIELRKKSYYPVERGRLYEGVFKSSNRGFGFITADDTDIFIPARNVKGAMNGDEVIAKQVRGRGPGGKMVGQIIKISRRANKRIVGRFEKKDRYGIVVPANKRLPFEIIIPSKSELKAETGDVVVVEIDIWTQAHRRLQGHIIKIIGRENDPGVDIDTIIYDRELPTSFSERTLVEAAGVKAGITEAEINRRLDLRSLFTVTIDGIDAKDFDDAVSIKVDEAGYFHLWVHIADVAKYVAYNDPIDEDARLRGNSVYLPDRVLPMLPFELSNDICSLKPCVDRLAYSVFMKIDPKGEVRDYKIAETVINSDFRLTYEEVDVSLRDDNYSNETLAYLIKSLSLLSQVLAEKRLARGSLEFETTEPKIILDEKLWPVEIKVREGTPAMKIIEEAMILTNETVAEFMFKAEAPMLYRIHERPDPEALTTIGELLKELGYPIKSLEGAHARTFQALIDFSRSRPERLLVNSLLLRAMRQARYSAAYKGHFGLASEHYTHFTSPIRRYCDLMVHRLVKAKIKRESDTDAAVTIATALGAVAEHCSNRERQAVSAEREAVDVKICQYMTKEVGGVFDGVISGVSSFGFFVELPNSAEGLVHIRNLKDDYYRFKANHLLLVGERTGKSFHLGQRVKVKLTNVSISKREVDFILAE